MNFKDKITNIPTIFKIIIGYASSLTLSFILGVQDLIVHGML